MTVNLPKKVRLAIYIANGALYPVMTYLLAKDIIGTLEMALYGAEAAFAFTVAGLNVPAEEE